MPNKTAVKKKKVLASFMQIYTDSTQWQYVTVTKLNFLQSNHLRF